MVWVKLEWGHSQGQGLTPGIPRGDMEGQVGLSRYCAEAQDRTVPVGTCLNPPPLAPGVCGVPKAESCIDKSTTEDAPHR